MVYSNGPSVVRDGLVLHLDAADRNSYTGSGTAWNDLSGNTNNGTLINGPTFSSNSRGSIVFDGTNDYVDCGVLTGLNSSSVTTNVWVRFSGALDSNDRKIFCYRKSIGSPYAAFQLRKGIGTTGFYYQFNNANNWYTAQIDNAMLYGDTWYNYASVHDGTNVKFYINGNLTNNFNFAAGIDYSNVANFLLGYRTSSEYWKGDMSGTKVYNRALSADEIAQNYNATKGRFGL